MADNGQQRLLDVIDDPNALESFLGFGGQCTSPETFDILDNFAGSGCIDTVARGGLTSASDLLPSVDTVASLAHSLAADYEVDSPNDTLFDNCLEASSNTLTDISQSYVPSDFDNSNYNLSNGVSQQHDLVSTNGTTTTNEGQQQQQQAFCTTQQQQSGTTTVDSGGGGSSGDINVLVNSTLQQQEYGNNVCDSTSFVQSSQHQQQQQPQEENSSSTPVSNPSFNHHQQNFSHLADLRCTQPHNVSQIPSLSSASSNNNNNHDIQNSTNNNVNESLTSTTTLSSATTNPSSDLISSVSTVASNSSNNNTNQNKNSNKRITTGIVSTFTHQQTIKDVSAQQKNIGGSNITTTTTTTTNNCEPPGNTNNDIPTNTNTIQLQQIQQQTLPQQQQFIVSAATQNINQLVSHQGQTVSLANMTMSPQLMTTNSVSGGLISSVIGNGQGTTNLMQIQSAPGQPQQFITITEQPQTLNLGAFGGNLGNLALVATGGGTQYAVLPTGSQIFSTNMIQPQKIHQATGQTFFQTPSGSIVATNSIQALQGVQSVNMSTPTIRAKQPQLLPKPTTLNSSVSTTNTITSLTQPASISNNPNLTSTLCSSSDNISIPSSNGGASAVGELQQHSVTVNSMGQIQIQQPVQVQQTNTNINNIVTSIGSNLSQPSFTIGNAPGLMVSGVTNMNSMTTQQQQAHLTGTIVLNQFGQPVLLPTAGNNNGLHTLILRQQPQVLTLGAPAAQASNQSSCKPIVRYVPQMPQNQTVQIQQIQTSNGPAFIAVRCPPTSTSQTSFVSSQIQSSEAVLSQTVQPSNNSSILHPHAINTIRQQTIGSLTSQNQSQITIKTEKPDVVQNQPQQKINSSAIPDTPLEVPPTKKKPSKSKKKKVTLDLDEILKQSGIGDEDLQDDSCFENSLPSEQQNVELMNGYQNIQSSNNNNNNLVTTPEPVKPNGCLTKPQNLPVNILPPHVHVLKPSTQASNKNPRNPINNNCGPGGAGTPPGSSRKPKSAPKRKAPVDKFPLEPPPAKQPSLVIPPPPHITPSNKKNSPKPTNNTISSNNNSKKKSNVNSTIKKSSPSPIANSQKGLTNNKITPSVPTSTYTSSPEVSSPIVTSSTMASASFTNPASNMTASNNNHAGQRIVHTIQLTPQNQQLLRNIQAQISRLAALPSRNENEQTALQKLIFLQQQVIATGTFIQHTPITVSNSSQLENANANNSALTVQAAATTRNIILSKEITKKETSKEKTDVTLNLSDDGGEDKGNHGASSGYSSGSRVPVVEDSKILEQRRAAAKVEEEARSRWKKEQFDFLLKRDQDFFVKADYKTPFSSKQDAVERLLKYHIARDRTEMDFEDFDAEFTDTAVRLLDKFSGMVAKYKTLLLKESMKEVSCAERVMVERTFCNEEKVKLDQDQLLVAQGEFPLLPPPPSTWLPKLQMMVDADVKEMELNSAVNQQVQSAIDSILLSELEPGSGMNYQVQVPDESEKIEYDAFGVPTSGNPSYVMGSSSSADIDEAVRSILA